MHATPQEKRLWEKLRNRQLGGHKFFRQEPVGRYIADFLCRERHIIVEVDGGQHADNPRDEERDAALRAAGYRVIRYWNGQV